MVEISSIFWSSFAAAWNCLNEASFVSRLIAFEILLTGVFVQLQNLQGSQYCAESNLIFLVDFHR